MHKPLLSRRRSLLAVGLLGSSPSLFCCQGLRAQASSAGAIANATINAAGVRTGTSGTNFFNVEAPSTGTNATFGVLDFSNSTLNPGGQTASGVQGGQLTLSLTESDAAFTAPVSLEFYLTTATGPSILAGTSTLKYNGTSAGDSSTPLYGIDTGLGAVGGNAAGSLFDLGSGSFTTTGNTATGTTDTYTLTLGGALNAFLTELNTSGGNVRLVVAASSSTGAATFFGYGSTAATAKKPTLAFTPTFSVGNPLAWQGGNGGSWTPTGTTNWSANPAGPGNTQWDNGGTATAIFANAGQTVNVNAGNVNAAGLEFDVTGYTVAGTGSGNTLTLTGSHTVNVVNGADIATVNAPIAGTVGLNKIGPGTLVLGGTNTYTGGTTITAGTLSISSAANIGPEGTNSGIVFNGGTLAAANGLNVLGQGRAITGTTGTLAYSGTAPLVLNGDVTLTSGLTLTGTGSVTFGDNTGRGYDTVPTLGFVNASTLATTGTLNVSTLNATHASGTAVIRGNVLFNTATTNVNVPNANATLQITGAVGTGSVGANGFTASTGVLVKQGAGTLDLLGDNSALTATSATSGSVRQGTASGTAPVSGGTIMVHTATGLGTGQYQFNNGTFSNASGGMLSFANGLSIGGGGGTGFGATFTGTAGSSSTFTGATSLYNPTGTAYQHVITVNAPTTFTGVFSTGTGSNNGLLIAGTSSLTLAPVAGSPNTFTEDVTVSGGTTLTLATTGALAANRSLSLLGNASLTLTLGTGTQDAINDAAFVSLAANSHVTLGGDNETVGGLALNGVTQRAGTYGAPGSGATNTSSYFTGSGILTNLGTTAPIPEPSTWAALLVGGFGLLVGRRKMGLRRVQPSSANL